LHNHDFVPPKNATTTNQKWRQRTACSSDSAPEKPLQVPTTEATRAFLWSIRWMGITVIMAAPETIIKWIISIAFVR